MMLLNQKFSCNYYSLYNAPLSFKIFVLSSRRSSANFVNSVFLPTEAKTSTTLVSSFNHYSSPLYISK